MRGEQGFALVITLVVTALLVALAVEFSDDVYVAAVSARTYVDAQQAGIMAESGVDGALRLLQLSQVQGYTTLQDRWAQPLAIEDEKGSLTVTIEDETGKLNLNVVTLPNGTFNEVYQGMAARLFKGQGLSPELCDSLADWIDDNDVPHPGGAENTYYGGLRPPYPAKNGRLETLEELRRVKGFDGPALERLRPLVTVYAEDPNAPAAPVNINTAPKELIVALDDKMTNELAERVIDYRKTTPFKSPADLARVPGLETIAPGLQLRIQTKGTVFRVTSRAQVNETVRVVEAVVRATAFPPAVLYWREY